MLPTLHMPLVASLQANATIDTSPNKLQGRNITGKPGQLSSQCSASSQQQPGHAAMLQQLDALGVAG
jgi:hypothetical protein